MLNRFKKHFFSLFWLTIIFGINLFLALESLISSQQHEHFSHQLSIGFISSIALIIYFRDKISSNTSGYISSSFRVLIILFVCLFTFLHLGPAKQLFAYHHQTQVADGSYHPCCMPQIGTIDNPTFLVAGQIHTEYILEKVTVINLPSILSINNKSPPLFS